MLLRDVNRPSFCVATGGASIIDDVNPKRKPLADYQCQEARALRALFSQQSRYTQEDFAAPWHRQPEFGPPHQPL